MSLRRRNDYHWNFDIAAGGYQNFTERMLNSERNETSAELKIRVLALLFRICDFMVILDITSLLLASRWINWA